MKRRHLRVGDELTDETAVVDITFADLDDGVRRLCGCEHQILVNPYHEA